MMRLNDAMSEGEVNDLLAQLQPGDEAVFSPGTYRYPIRITSGGDSAETAVVVRFEEGAVVDGEYQFPKGQPDERLYHPDAEPVHHSPLVAIEASFVRLIGAEVMRSAGRGIRAGVGDQRLQGIVIEEVRVRECRHRGVGFQNVDGGALTGSEIFHCGNFAMFPRPADNDPDNHDGVNWPTITGLINSTDIVIEGNMIYRSWGELIAAGLNCSNIHILNNIVWDGFLGIYANRCQETEISGNLVYHTGNRDFYRGSRSASPGNGIEAQNEAKRDGLPAKNILIQDNIVAGWGRGLVSGGGQGTGEMPTDLFYVNNTLIENVRHDGKGSAIQLLPLRSITTVSKNLIQQQGDRVIAGGQGDGYAIVDNLTNKTTLPTVAALLERGEPVTRAAFVSPVEGYGARVVVTPPAPVEPPVIDFFDTAFAAALDEAELDVAALMEMYGSGHFKYMPGHRLAMLGYKMMQHIAAGGADDE